MSNRELYAVILAAGSGRRFGGIKQLAAWQGTTLVAQAARNAESVCGPRSVLVIGGEHGRQVHEAAAPLAGYFVVNEHAADGMGTSLAAAARALRAVAGGVMITLADQPLVNAEHLENLAGTWRRDTSRIVATRFSGRLGPPVIFPRRCLAALRSLTGDQGARDVIRDDPSPVLACDFEPAAVDIDEPSDLERFQP